MLRRCLLCFCLLMNATAMHASVALLMEEPFGTFGYVNPTGHAAIYLSEVCAASPTKLRRCSPGEGGVVISRYHRVAGHDWIAIPLIPYLYAVDKIDEIPTFATLEDETRVRDTYRRAYLEDFAPDGPGGAIPTGEWIQLIGASYDRKIYVFEVDSTADLDDRFIAAFNDRSNVSHFNLLFNNCADLARVILNFYYPGAVHRSVVADLGLTTPKHVRGGLHNTAAVTRH